MYTIDVERVFEVMGGPRGLLTCLDIHQPDHGLTYNNLQMWLRRKAIPSKWLGAVLYCGERQGHQCHEFLHDDDPLGLRIRGNARPRR